MAGAVAVQVAREDVFENFEAEPVQQRLEATPAAGEQPVVADARCDAPREEAQVAVVTSEANAGAPEPPTEASATGGALDQGVQPGPIVVTRHTKLAPYKPGKMTVVLDMDECLLHSKFHGPGAASEAYRQLEERPDAVNEVNSFWVALDDGDTAQVRRETFYHRAPFFSMFLDSCVQLPITSSPELPPFALPCGCGTRLTGLEWPRPTRLFSFFFFQKGSGKVSKIFSV